MPQLAPFNFSFFMITFVIFIIVVFYLLNTLVMPHYTNNKLARLFLIK
ncbi:hypothetical protein QEN19_000011 (mitochondrion) [Hanseniaspora menglaensis]